MRHRTDGGQRFPAEPIAGHTHKILRAPNLRGGVPREGEQCVVAVHPAPVVADPQQEPAPLFDIYVDGRRAGIERVLDQFLHRRRRTLDHLAGGDLVSDGAGEH